MAAITTEKPVPVINPRIGDFSFSVKASTTILAGAAVGTDASGYLVNVSGPSANNSAIKPQGIAQVTVDNSAGASGAKLCRVQKAVFPFVNLTGDPVTIANNNSTVYFEDNQTIRATDNGGTRCAAGTMRGFDAYGNVLVDMTLV